MERLKSILIEVLTIRGKYFLKIENEEKINQTIEELSKWTADQNLEFKCFSLVKLKKYAEAMKLIQAQFTTKPPKDVRQRIHFTFRKNYINC
jgi:tRNA/tmRNA/rRNA uracil-C5-methylase (TrmA/RlmC/RlmD family)